MGIDMALSPARALFRYWHAIFGLHQNQHRLDLSVGIKGGFLCSISRAFRLRKILLLCADIFEEITRLAH